MSIDRVWNDEEFGNAEVATSGLGELIIRSGISALVLFIFSFLLRSPSQVSVIRVGNAWYVMVQNIKKKIDMIIISHVHAYNYIDFSSNLSSPFNLFPIPSPNYGFL